MKVTQLIQISLVSVFILTAWSEALAWSRHHYRYDHHDRFFHRHYYPSPYYRSYRHYRHPYHHDYRWYRQDYTMADGWNMVRQGRSGIALNIFEDLSERHPGAGGPKLGYAIAAADTGRLEKSVWAMRRALQFGPGAVQIFKPDRQLEGKLKRLVEKYQGRSHGLPDKDAYFMQAALYYMLADKAACSEAIRLSREMDDTSDSAKNLYFMAEKYL